MSELSGLEAIARVEQQPTILLCKFDATESLTDTDETSAYSIKCKSFLNFRFIFGYVQRDETR